MLSFEICRSLESITIHSSVTEIGDWAFQGCRALSAITIPNSVLKLVIAPLGDVVLLNRFRFLTV